jgi:hypothetical protein
MLLTAQQTIDMPDKIYRQNFSNGVNSDIADELMPEGMVRDMVNIDIFSSDGTMGVATNIWGNVQIEIDLPEGENRAIGRPLLDEENNRMFLFIQNSEGYHTIYEYNHSTESVTRVFQDITDTGGNGFLGWRSTDLLVHSDIINGNILTWSMKGFQPRWMNIDKAKDKTTNGYGQTISDHTIRAYKRTAKFPPVVRYITDPDTKFNNVYGNLFKFATRYIYDDGQKSHFSDFSKVAIPDKEDITGSQGVPLENNAISVTFNSGDNTVTKIELIMQKTNNVDGGFQDWVSIGIFDKSVIGINDSSDYEYIFYNDVPYLSIPQSEVLLPYSMLPRDPACQMFTNNSLIYTNFTEGFEPVVTDVEVEVTYEDLYIDSSSTPVWNDPTIIINELDHNWVKSSWLGGEGYRLTKIEVIIGPDVKKGNRYSLISNNKTLTGRPPNFTSKPTVQIESKVASRNDTSFTMASDIANRLRGLYYTDGRQGSYVGEVTTDGAGNSRFEFNICNDKGNDYFSFYGIPHPVQYEDLSDTGSSVVNRKLGSAFRAFIVYEDDDTRRTLSYPIGDNISISNLNELGEIKSAVVSYMINHLPPEWAVSYQIYETRDLVHQDFIQIMIQTKVNYTEDTSGTVFHDLVIGSLHTYQEMHPNNTLRYEFKKGDRVRLLREYTEDDGWTVPTDVIEYEVVDYFETVTDVIDSNIKINNTNIVETNNPDANNIGSYISIRGFKRRITGVTSSGYELESSIKIDNSNDVTEPSYSIINNRGVLRIKENPAYPINANGSDEFAIVEVYKPYRESINSENEISYAIGEKYDIITVNGVKYHQGNTQDQSAVQPAIVRTEGIDSYVRNREMPTSDDPKNPQTLLAKIEDRSYSDFYYSNLSSYGRAGVVDNGRGVVHLGSASVFTNNFIAGTDVNGLSMVLPESRVDYNDSYGDINRTMFHEGRGYIFKALKTGFVIIKGNIINSPDGSTNIVGLIKDLMPDKMEYFVWEGGIGNEIDGVVRDGNNIYYVSPNSGVLSRIGYSGSEPISKQKFLDKEIRQTLSDASASNARVHLGFDRSKGNITMVVDPYKKVYFDDGISVTTTSIVELPTDGEWEIVRYPSNGTVSINSDGEALYDPSPGFIGIDFFSYRNGDGQERFIYVNILA